MAFTVRQRSLVPVAADARPLVVDCDHLAASGTGWTRCRACGARCERDSDGAIVEYSAGGGEW